MMATSACARCHRGYRFPAGIIGHAVWLYFRFPLGLRLVEELLAAGGIIVSHERWGNMQHGLPIIFNAYCQSFTFGDRN
jgi:transposase-like protein